MKVHFDCKSGVAREEHGSLFGSNLGSCERKLACAGTAPYQMARNDRVTEPVLCTGSITLV